MKVRTDTEKIDYKIVEVVKPEWFVFPLYEGAGVDPGLHPARGPLCGAYSVYPVTLVKQATYGSAQLCRVSHDHMQQQDKK